MRTPFLLTLAFVASAPALQADRFYFGSKAEDEKLETLEGKDARSVLSGVLLREQDGMYVIRVEGGEVWVEQSRVYQIEKDDLTVAQIEERERAAQDELRAQLAALHARQAQVAEAAARREAAESPQESSKTDALTVEVDFTDLLPGYRFDPQSEVLQRVDLVGLAQEIESWLAEHGAQPPADAQRDFTVHVDFKGLLPAYGFRIYDPVIHRVDLRGLARQVEDYLRAEVRAAANRGKRPGTVH